jgi:anaerobic magnesium-protoporphyrin IX monomethyl ester cyclase
LVGGGPYPSSSYNDVLLAGLVDIAVIGEGEITFVDLIGRLRVSSAIPDDLKGTAVKESGKVKINDTRPLIQNIDIIPFPDYNFINLKDYTGIENHALQDSSRSAFILSSRGCPYGCFYCHQLFGKKIRRRSAENVVAEMRERIEKHGIFDFVFLDDIFNVPMPDAKELLSLIIKELPEVRINFPNGLRADMIDEEMLDLFERAGTVEMALAVETAVPRLQKLMGKNLDINKAEKAIHAASKRFITRTLFIIGFPTETYEEAVENIDFAASFEYAAQPMLSVLRIYNNSKLYNLLDPTEEQAAAMATQEKKVLHLEMFDDIEFYGDLFPAEKVPLKSNDLKELLYYWMRNVFINPNRINKSHEVLKKHLDQKKILEFYSNVFNKPKFNENDLLNLLKP